MFNIQSTTEYNAIKELQVMNQYSSDALKQFKMYTQYAYNTFWFGEVSPIEKMQLIGTEALNLFTKSAQAQAFIKSIEPEYETLSIPEGYSIEWNEDGSGTIIYTAPVVEEETAPVVEEETAPVVEEEIEEEEITPQE